MTFQEALTEIFAKRMNFKPGDPQFALVIQAAELLGNVREPEMFANKIVNMFLEYLSPEIVDCGADVINSFLIGSSYTDLQQKFLISIVLCNPDK